MPFNDFKKTNIKKYFFLPGILALIALLIVCILVACHSNSDAKKIGIIVPLEHKAMDEIVAGFTETLSNEMKIPLQFKVQNAQGDMNIERAIIQQMNNSQYDMVVPIGITATQMSLATIHHQPIIGLAAHFTEKERKEVKPCNITAVHDEIPLTKSLAFLHRAYPNLTQLTLVHSAEDKVFRQVDEARASGISLGITVKPLMVPTLNELYSIAKAIPANSQGIFVLKDHTIASGIATLAMVAKDRHLPLMTSDQDSVLVGAGFSLGVPEREIGVLGAKLAKAVLDGQPVCSIPIVDMPNIRVFINQKMLTDEGQSQAPIIKAAKESGYPIEFVDAKREQKENNHA